MKLTIIKSIFVLAILFCSVNSHGQINYSAMGNKAYDNMQYILAIEYFTKVLDKNDLDKNERNDVTYKLGECYFKTNNPKKARAFYLRLIKNKFSNEKPNVLLHYGLILNMLEAYKEALPLFEQYLKKFPNDNLALAGKATCELCLEDKTVSKKWTIRNIRELNTNLDDFAANFSDNNATSIMFTSNRKGTTGNDIDNWTNGYFSDIFIANKTKGITWGNIKLVDNRQKINTFANEGVTCFTNGYTKFYFTRCDKMGDNKMFCEILESVKSSSVWSTPTVVYSDKEGNVGHPAIKANGLEMIFSSNRPGGYGGKDLWKVSRHSENTPFGNPVNLGPNVNTAADEMFPSFQNDTILYFASNGKIGYGGLDIYYVRIKNDLISFSEHLPRPINSSYDDFAMFFEPNKESGFFTSRRIGGKGGDDIYSFEKIISKISIQGTVTDENTKEPMSGLAVLLTTKMKDTLIVTTSTNGTFKVPNEKIKQKSIYTLTFAKDQYFTKTHQLVVEYPENDTTYLISISLLKIPEKPIVLPDIYYELDKWDLLPQYQDSLMTLVTILNDNPKIVIELASHTDSRASDEYNDQLSQKRAETVVNFLTEKGIQKERLIAKGYGERKPRTLTSTVIKDGYTFPSGTVITEEFVLSIKDLKRREVAYQLNRRTEFSVIKKNFK